MPNDLLALAIFAATYLFLALGRVRGLALDRTGFALLGAVAFLAADRISLADAKDAVDAPTLVVLFGMMLLSAQYQLSGLYDEIGHRLTRVAGPRRLLAGTIAVSALLAAVLTNDVVCFALTPLLGRALLRTRLDPLPYLLAIACATNIGSALTPIGNPQNILVAQAMSLPFAPFVAVCAPPVLLALLATYLLIAPRLREREGPPPEATAGGEDLPLDRRQSVKAVLLTGAAILLFLTPTAAHLTALAVAGVVLTSRRMHTRTMLGLVDWQMLALFASLFVVTRGLELSGWTETARQALAAAGLPLENPPVLLGVAAVAGNLVGNVPAVMLLLRFLPADPASGYALALASTFAGNALLVGSVANLIVAERAAAIGIDLSWRTHLRVGLPVTLVSLAIAGLWLAFLAGV